MKALQQHPSQGPRRECLLRQRLISHSRGPGLARASQKRSVASRSSQGSDLGLAAAPNRPPQPAVVAPGAVRRLPSGDRLPDQQLLGSIKSCGSWWDCQQLLASSSHRLDAMLLSTLVTQTVHVYLGPGDTAGLQQQQLQQQQQQQLQQQQQQQQQGPGAAAAANSNINQPHTAASSSRSAGGGFSAYLRALSQASLQLSSSFRPQQFSNVLWGLAKCGLRPPAVWTNTYLARAELHLVRFPPRNLAQLLWAVARMQAAPPRSFCAAFLAESGDKLWEFKPLDIANTLWALATLGLQPPPDWLSAALAAAEQQWQRFRPQELSITLWAFAKLGQGLGVQGPQQQAACAAAGCSSSRGLDSAAFDRLMAAVAWQLPAMRAQECSNTLWGLAAGGAGRDLSQRQTEWLAQQALVVLQQGSLSSSRNSSSSSSSSSRRRDDRGAVQALCTVVWALTRLHWRPTLQQVQQLLQLLPPELSQPLTPSSSSSNVGSAGSSGRQAALLVWCFGRLRIRPPAATLQQLLRRQEAALAAAVAAPADLVQVLVGCRALGFRPGDPWWSVFYSLGQEVVCDASVGELGELLAAAAALQPPRPSQAWWAVVWGQLRSGLELTVRARGLTRRGQLAAAAGGSSSSSSSSSSRQRGRQHSSSSSSRPAGQRGCSLAAGDPWAVAQRCLHNTSQLQASAVPLPRSLPPRLAWRLARPRTLVLLLWSCAALRLLPPKKSLWLVLLLVLLDEPTYTAPEMTVIFWSLGRLLAVHGHHVVQCRSLMQHLLVAALVRLHGPGTAAEASRLRRAVRFLHTKPSSRGLCCSSTEAMSRAAGAGAVAGGGARAAVA